MFFPPGAFVFFATKYKNQNLKEQLDAGSREDQARSWKLAARSCFYGHSF